MEESDMSDSENARAQAEAQHESDGATNRALRSARRAQLWAGFNRYLQSEAALASKASAEEQSTRHRDEDQHEPDEERQETP
jgi:hypothetical protein